MFCCQKRVLRICIYTRFRIQKTKTLVSFRPFLGYSRLTLRLTHPSSWNWILCKRSQAMEIIGKFPFYFPASKNQSQRFLLNKILLSATLVKKISNCFFQDVLPKYGQSASSSPYPKNTPLKMLTSSNLSKYNKICSKI